MAERQGKTTTRVNLRSGPGVENASLRLLETGTTLKILADVGEWLQVDAAGVQGFVSEKFVAQEAQAVPAGLAGTETEPFRDVAMPPSSNRLIPVGARATSVERLVASTWNKSGNLLATLAGHLKFDAGAAVAVFCTESGGKGFGPDGRVLIRFENHHFFADWGKAHRALFDTHFVFNAQKPWLGHQWRAAAGARFEDVHKDQGSEWRTFEFARA